MLREKVQELCKSKGVSLRKAEIDCGFAQGYLSKIGKSTPSGKKLKILADYFGITVDQLIETDESSPTYYFDQETAELAQELFQNKDLRTLLSASRKLSPEELLHITKFIEGMVKRDEHRDLHEDC